MSRETTFCRAIMLAEDVIEAEGSGLQAQVVLNALHGIPAIPKGTKVAKREASRLQALSTLLDKTVNREPWPSNPSYWGPIRAIAEYRDLVRNELVSIFTELGDTVTVDMLLAADNYKPLQPQVGFIAIPTLENYHSIIEEHPELKPAGMVSGTETPPKG